MKYDKLIADIDEGRLVTLTRELVAIPSENPPGNEGAVAHYIADFFTAQGIQPKMFLKVPERPNVIVKLPGKSKDFTLLLTGHTDVVPAGAGWKTNPYKPVVRSGRIFGRGTCDMKGGLACILHVVELLLKHQVPLIGSLICAFTVAEETGGEEGAAYLMEKKLIRANMGILVEPSGFQLVLAEEGVLWIKLVTHGVAAHTLSAATASNAVEQMTLLLSSLMVERASILECGGKKTEEPILSINTLKGGDKPNVIPGKCEATIDVRIPPGCDLSIDKVKARLSSFFEKRQESFSKLKIEIEYKTVAQPFQQPSDAEIVYVLSDCAAKVLGNAPQIVGPIPSTDEDSDAYHYWTKGRIPTVYFGPGQIEQAHAANEYIEISQLGEATKILMCAVITMLAK